MLRTPLDSLRLIALAASLAAAACAPIVKPAGPVTVEARLAPDRLIATDGRSLPLRLWLPDNPRAVVVALHGFNEYSEAFDDPGKVLADRGIAVYAFDQRGFGRSPDHGYWAGTATLADDVAALIRQVAARHPGTPVYLLGESMGGALAMVTLTRTDAPAVQGVILSAPAVWDRDSMGVLQSGALWIASYTVPWLTLTGQGLHIMASDNIPMLRRLGADPLVIKETRVDAIHGLCDLMDEAAAAAPRLHVPILVLYGTHDQVVPAEPEYRMMARLPDTPHPPVKAVYENGWHMLMRDLQANVVLIDIVAWIDHPDRPLPSGADRQGWARIEAARGADLP